MKTLLFDDSIENLCEKNAHYQNALGLLSDEPCAAEMKAFSSIEDKYMTALREAVLYLVDEIKTIKKSHKQRDGLSQCEYTKCVDEEKTDNEYKLIVGKFKNGYHRNTGKEDQDYTFVVVPWNDNVALHLFKAKNRRAFYSSEAVEREVLDVRRYIYNNPTAEEIEDLREYLEVLRDGADRMFEVTVSPYIGK